jgi:hypothetical protein
VKHRQLQGAHPDEPPRRCEETSAVRIIHVKAKGLAILYISHRLAEIYQSPTPFRCCGGQLIGSRPPLSWTSSPYFYDGQARADIYPDKADRAGRFS